MRASMTHRAARRGAGLGAALALAALLGAAGLAPAMAGVPEGFRMSDVDICNGYGGELETARGETAVVAEGSDYDLRGCSDKGSICWNQSLDTCHFAGGRLVGDFDASVEVAESADLADDATVIAALAARECLDPYSPAIGLNLFNSKCREFNEPGHMTGRPPDGTNVDKKWIPGQPRYVRKFPIWARLVREKNVFTTFFSYDGKDWKLLDKAEIALPETLYVGLAVNAKGVTVKFRNLQVKGAAAPRPGARPPAGTGTGLAGQYFKGKDFARPLFARVDPEVRMDFPHCQPPDPARMNYADYAVRWTGEVEPRFSEPATFILGVDDGGRLWIDGKLVIDQWKDQGYTAYYHTMPVEAGKKYKIKIEYYDGKWGGGARLYWRGPSQPTQIIPAGQLYPDESVKVTDLPPALAPQTPPGTLIEAESAELAGGAKVLDDKPQVAGDKSEVSGGKYVGGTGGKGCSITLKKVDGGKTDCLHSLAVRYLTPEAAAGKLPTTRNLHVNGALIGTVTFFGENRWRVLAMRIPLKAGTDNTVELRNEAGDGADIKFDCFRLDGEMPFEPRAGGPGAR